ncbi:sulfotransferase 1C4-like [Tachypleus tridentatus]|uniref:sulfotransferase 1C4-like n=1 Tax=Tachypleus tridentatus TaxID=6853 RepID=UPI003FD13968
MINFTAGCLFIYFLLSIPVDIFCRLRNLLKQYADHWCSTLKNLFNPTSKNILPKYKIIEGRRYPPLLPSHYWYTAIKYKPKPDDVFICTYPKSGTTWMQQIVLLILNKGERHENYMDFVKRTPFLEAMGSESIMDMPARGPIKTHLPFHLIPYSSEAKYIYIIRNPKDCCVSFYHHTKMIPMYRFQKGSFETFFELFIKGETDFGDYFDHLLSWYPHRSNPNVLFLTYEWMKEHHREAVLKVADFIGKEYHEMLIKNEGLLQRILHYSSLEYMKQSTNKDLEDFFNTNPFKIIFGRSTPSFLRFGLLRAGLGDLKKPKKVDFVRKGQVGDWRQYFTHEQSRRFDAKVKALTAGTDIVSHWNDCL